MDKPCRHHIRVKNPDYVSAEAAFVGKPPSGHVCAGHLSLSDSLRPDGIDPGTLSGDIDKFSHITGGIDIGGTGLHAAIDKNAGIHFDFIPGHKTVSREYPFSDDHQLTGDMT